MIEKSTAKIEKKKPLLHSLPKPQEFLRKNNDFINHTKALDNTTFKYSSFIN